TIMATFRPMTIPRTSDVTSPPQAWGDLRRVRFVGDLRHDTRRDEGDDPDADRVAKDVLPREDAPQDPVGPGPPPGERQRYAGPLEQLDDEANAEGKHRQVAPVHPRRHERDREVHAHRVQRVPQALVPERPAEVHLARDDADRERGSEEEREAHA